jgi:hypothetical protein
MPLFNNSSYAINEFSARISRFATPSWVVENGLSNHYPLNEEVSVE